MRLYYGSIERLPGIVNQAATGIAVEGEGVLESSVDSVRTSQRGRRAPRRPWRVAAATQADSSFRREGWMASVAVGAMALR